MVRGLISGMQAGVAAIDIVHQAPGVVHATDQLTLKRRLTSTMIVDTPYLLG
jgi:hypothetical protein